MPMLTHPSPSAFTPDPAVIGLYCADQAPLNDLDEADSELESELDPETRPEDLPEEARENLEGPAKIPGPIPDPGPL